MYAGVLTYYYYKLPVTALAVNKWRVWSDSQGTESKSLPQ